jgi:hypothetical protein
MSVYRQTQLYSLLMLLCYMFRPITIAILRLLRGGGFFTFKFYNAIVTILCALQDLVLHALC